MDGIDELKEAIKKGHILFGIKQYRKNAKDVKKVFVPSNAREQALKQIDREKIINIGLGKEELRRKLEIDFLCEVFSLFDKLKISEKKIEGKAEAGKKRK